MRKVLVVVCLVFLAFPVMARAEDQEHVSLIGKLETILTNLTEGYNSLMTGLMDLQTGQEELQMAQAELYGGLNTLYQGLKILQEEQIRLNQDVTALDLQLSNLKVSYEDYKIATEIQLKRQRAFLIGGGALAGAVCIVTLYLGGR